MKRTFSLLSICTLVLVGCNFSLPGSTDTSDSPSPVQDTVEPQAKTTPTFDGTLLTGKHTVTIKTSMGDITTELDADAAPRTVTNFITLAKAGYYDNLVFHRVINDFMVQGGDPEGNGTGGESIYGETFEDEINAMSYGLHEKKLADVAAGQPIPDELKDASVKDYFERQGYNYNDALQSLPMGRGYLAMANRGANTNASQFFIIQKEGGTPWLEGKHTVFGKVTAGMDVVDQIVKVPRDALDKPLKKITYTMEVAGGGAMMDEPKDEAMEGDKMEGEGDAMEGEEKMEGEAMEGDKMEGEEHDGMMEGDKMEGEEDKAMEEDKPAE